MNFGGFAGGDDDDDDGDFDYYYLDVVDYDARIVAFDDGDDDLYLTFAY